MGDLAVGETVLLLGVARHRRVSVRKPRRGELGEVPLLVAFCYQDSWSV